MLVLQHYIVLKTQVEYIGLLVVPVIPSPALTCLNEKVIIIKEKVYNDAANDFATARLIIAHELGHADLHSGQRITEVQPLVESWKRKHHFMRMNCWRQLN